MDINVLVCVHFTTLLRACSVLASRSVSLSTRAVFVHVDVWRSTQLEQSCPRGHAAAEHSSCLWISYEKGHITDSIRDYHNQSSASTNFICSFTTSINLLFLPPPACHFQLQHWSPDIFTVPHLDMPKPSECGLSGFISLPRPHSPLAQALPTLASRPPTQSPPVSEKHQQEWMYTHCHLFINLFFQSFRMTLFESNTWVFFPSEINVGLVFWRPHQRRFSVTTNSIYIYFFLILILNILISANFNSMESQECQHLKKIINE